jgi:hypothetical protein
MEERMRDRGAGTFVPSPDRLARRDALLLRLDAVRRDVRRRGGPSRRAVHPVVRRLA